MLPVQSSITGFAPQVLDPVSNHPPADLYDMAFRVVDLMNKLDAAANNALSHTLSLQSDSFNAVALYRTALLLAAAPLGAANAPADATLRLLAATSHHATSYNAAFQASIVNATALDVAARHAIGLLNALKAVISSTTTLNAAHLQLNSAENNAVRISIKHARCFLNYNKEKHSSVSAPVNLPATTKKRAHVDVELKANSSTNPAEERAERAARRAAKRAREREEIPITYGVLADTTSSEPIQQPHKNSEQNAVLAPPNNFFIESREEDLNEPNPWFG